MSKHSLWVICIVCAAATVAGAKSLTLDELRAALNSRGARWMARESSISRLPQSSRRLLLGAPSPTGDVFVARGASKTDLFPAHFSWGDANGTSYLSPILDQGRCGSCVAFATVGTLETQMNIARHTPFSPFQFSPQHLFSCGGGTCQMGWTPEEAVSYLKASGVPDEACFPYTSGALGQDAQCSSTCSDSAARSLKIEGSSQPTSWSLDIDAVKQALLKGPLITTMSVYEDFYYYGSGVYRHVTGANVGGHALSIVGWDNSEQAWIVRNSWGTDWGVDGFFHIAWDDQDSGLATDTWLLQIADANTVTVQGIPPRAIWRGKAEISVQSTYPGSDQLAWRLSKAGATVASGSANGKRVTIDTTAIADGEYELTATAHTPDASYSSQPYAVSIANGTIGGKLSFTNIKDGDSLQDTKQLEFDVTSTPVPFQRVIFRTREIATGATSQRGTTNVATHMAVNWRNTQLPRGTYELWLEGSDGAIGSVSSTPIRVTLK